jgi:hypothetical protein
MAIETRKDRRIVETAIRWQTLAAYLRQENRDWISVDEIESTVAVMLEES